MALSNALLRYKRRKTKQAKAGNEDGKDLEKGSHLADSLLVRAFSAIYFINKVEFKGPGRILFFEPWLNFRQRFCRVSWPEMAYPVI